MTGGALYVGTSGWSYAHWRGLFYPPGLPQRQWLEYYCGRFDTVELNTTFYHLPSEASVAHWFELSPGRFRFAAKVSRYITHTKRLREPELTLPPLLQRLAPLEEKLGCLLFQLPPAFACNPARLEAFLAQLEPGFRWAFEFRNPDWLRPEIYAALEAAGVALCLNDYAKRVTPEVLSADFVYLRLHGPHGDYRGSYSEAQLVGWAERIDAWRGQGRDVYVYFNNDEAGHAPANALALKKRVFVFGE